MCNAIWAQSQDCCFREGVYHDSFWLSRKGLFALQRSYDSWKGLRSQHGKDFQLHNLLGSPRPVNKPRTISASLYKVIAISCKKMSKILCKQLLHQCVDRCASFLNQNGWGGEGGQGGQNLPPPIPCSPASRTFISRLSPFSVLLPSPVNWQSQNTF